MNRLRALIAVLVAVGTAFVSGAADPKPANEKVKLAKPISVVGHKTAVFNMAAVMRDFGLAKYRVHLLNTKKAELSKNIVAWRGEYIEIQRELQANPAHPKKDEKAQRMLDLARKIEDDDRKLGKQLNDEATAIIADLYDKVQSVVEKTAQLNGYQLVFAYPDAVTPEELNSPYIKELHLKPPAAHPFYVDPSVDLTRVIVKTLNESHPPIDKETGKEVDTSKLQLPPAAAAPTPAALPPVPVPSGNPLPPPVVPKPGKLPPVPTIPGTNPK